MIDFSEVNTIDVIIKVIIGGGIAGLVYYLDRRRRNDAKNAHKKIIKMNLGTINEIIEYMTYHVSNIEDDIDGTPSKLNQYIIRHHVRMESLIQDIQIQQAHSDKMKPHEEEMIKDAITSARWILDTYYRQDIPEPQRERVWVEPHNELHDHAKTIIQAHNGI